MATKPPAKDKKDDEKKEAAKADCKMCATDHPESWPECEHEHHPPGKCFLVIVITRPFGPSSGAMTLSILEGEIYCEYVEARVCQDGGCEARPTPRPLW